MGLFKYFTARDYHIKAFDDQKLFFSFPKAFNDCFDTSSILYDNFPKFCAKMGWTHKEMIPNIDNHGICCFTKAKEADSLRMWNLYANGMDGFALEFDENVLTHPDLMSVHLLPVRYRKHVLDLDNEKTHFRIEGERFCIGDITRYSTKELDRLFEYLHVCKERNQWSCENELRMIIGEQITARGIDLVDKGYRLTLPRMPYKSLTIGFKVSDGNEQVLRQIAKKYGISVRKAFPCIVNKKMGVRLRLL